MTITYVEPVGLEPTAVSLKGYYSTIELRFHVVTHDPSFPDHFHLRENQHEGMRVQSFRDWRGSCGIRTRGGY